MRRRSLAQMLRPHLLWAKFKLKKQPEFSMKRWLVWQTRDNSESLWVRGYQIWEVTQMQHSRRQRNGLWMPWINALNQELLKRSIGLTIHYNLLNRKAIKRSRDDDSKHTRLEQINQDIQTASRWDKNEYISSICVELEWYFNRHASRELFNKVRYLLESLYREQSRTNKEWR